MWIQVYAKVVYAFSTENVRGPRITVKSCIESSFSNNNIKSVGESVQKKKKRKFIKLWQHPSEECVEQKQSLGPRLQQPTPPHHVKGMRNSVEIL